MRTITSIVFGASVVCSQQRQRDILAHRQGADQCAALECQPDFLADGIHLARTRLGDVHSLDVHLSGGRLLEPHQSAQQRALSRAGTADHHQRLAMPHVESESVQNLPVAVCARADRSPQWPARERRASP